MKKLLLFSSVLLLTLIYSCDESVSTIPQVENGNFILFVSNQSSYIDPVDIKVFIDGKLAVNQEFLSKGGHNWIEFQFQLKNGIHKLFSSSTKGNLRKDTLFTLPATPYGDIDFWYYPKSSGSIEFKKMTIFFTEGSPGFM
jgi:hypothetical protein